MSQFFFQYDAITIKEPQHTRDKCNATEWLSVKWECYCTLKINKRTKGEAVKEWFAYCSQQALKKKWHMVCIIVGCVRLCVQCTNRANSHKYKIPIYLHTTSYSAVFVALLHLLVYASFGMCCEYAWAWCGAIGSAEICTRMHMQNMKNCWLNRVNNHKKKKQNRKEERNNDVVLACTAHRHNIQPISVSR